MHAADLLTHVRHEQLVLIVRKRRRKAREQFLHALAGGGLRRSPERRLGHRERLAIGAARSSIHRGWNTGDDDMQSEDFGGRPGLGKRDDTLEPAYRKRMAPLLGRHHRVHGVTSDGAQAHQTPS